jgi:hypothetical protein
MLQDCPRRGVDALHTERIETNNNRRGDPSQAARGSAKNGFSKCASGFIVFGEHNVAVTHPAITSLPYERSIAPWVRGFFPDAQYVQRGDDVRRIHDDDLPLESFRGVLALQGAKGLGKSKAVHAAVARLPPSTTAVQITFRRCLAWSSNRLMGERAALYTDIPASAPISARSFPRLTILINSIARVRGCYDVVVIDELVSVVDMLAGRRLMGAEARIAALFTLAQLIAGARVVLVADAVLDAACLQFVCMCRRINEPLAAVPMRVVDYTYRLHGDYSYVAHENELTWRRALDAALREGQHVVVPCMTKGMATRLAAAYQDAYDVRCYTADVDPARLHEHMRDIHTHWSGAQLLVYSPVITAGCSFELPHYDTVFFYGMAGLGSVRSAMQMIARVRSVATKTVHVYIARAQRYAPLTDGELRQFLGSACGEDDNAAGAASEPGQCLSMGAGARVGIAHIRSTVRSRRRSNHSKRRRTAGLECASHNERKSTNNSDHDEGKDAGESDTDLRSGSDADSDDSARETCAGKALVTNGALSTTRTAAYGNPAGTTTADVQMQLLRHLDLYTLQEEALAALAFPFYFWSLVVHSGAHIAFPGQHLLDRVPRSLLPAPDDDDDGARDNHHRPYVRHAADKDSDGGGTSPTPTISARKPDRDDSDNDNGNGGDAQHAKADADVDADEDEDDALELVQYPLWSAVAAESWLLHDWDSVATAARFTGPDPYPSCPGDLHAPVPSAASPLSTAAAAAWTQSAAGGSGICLRPSATLLQKAHVLHPEHCMASGLAPLWSSVRRMAPSKTASAEDAVPLPTDMDHQSRARLRAWSALIAQKGLARLGSRRGGGGVYVRNLAATWDVLRDECEAYCQDAGICTDKAALGGQHQCPCGCARVNDCYGGAGTGTGTGAGKGNGEGEGDDKDAGASPASNNSSVSSSSSDSGGSDTARPPPRACDDTRTNSKTADAAPPCAVVVIMFPPAATFAQVSESTSHCVAACSAASSKYMSEQTLWLDVYREEAWVLAGMETAVRTRRAVTPLHVATFRNRLAPADTGHGTTDAPTDTPPYFEPDLARATTVVDRVTELVMRLRPRFIALNVAVGLQGGTMAVADVLVLDVYGQWHVLIYRTSGTPETAAPDHDLVKALAVGAALDATLQAAVPPEVLGTCTRATRCARRQAASTSETARHAGRSRFIVTSISLVYLQSGACVRIDTDTWAPAPLLRVLTAEPAGTSPASRALSAEMEHQPEQSGPWPWSACDSIAYGVCSTALTTSTTKHDGDNCSGSEEEEDAARSSVDSPVMYVMDAVDMAAVITDEACKGSPAHKDLLAHARIVHNVRDVCAAIKTSGITAQAQPPVTPNSPLQPAGAITLYACRCPADIKRVLKAISRRTRLGAHAPASLGTRLVCWGYASFYDAHGPSACDGRIHDMQAWIALRVTNDVDADIPLETMRVQHQDRQCSRALHTPSSSPASGESTTDTVTVAEKVPELESEATERLERVWDTLSRTRKLHRGIMRNGLCVCFWNGRPHGVGMRVIPPITHTLGIFHSGGARCTTSVTEQRSRCPGGTGARAHTYHKHLSQPASATARSRHMLP